MYVTFILENLTSDRVSGINSKEGFSAAVHTKEYRCHRDPGDKPTWRRVAVEDKWEGWRGLICRSGLK